MKYNKELHLFLSDLHIPYEDKGCLKAVFHFIREFRPGTIHLVGDVMDFYGVSAHSKDPARKESLFWELEQGRKFLKKLREVAPWATIRYTEGNHETRMTRHLWKVTPELAELPELMVPNLLGLRDLNIGWHPEAEPYLVGDLLVSHGSYIRKHSAYTAKAESESRNRSTITGHTHRLGSYYRQTDLGLLESHENGCLCNLKHSIFGYMKGRMNWHQGFTVAQVIGKSIQVQSIKLLGKDKNRFYIFNGERWPK